MKRKTYKNMEKAVNIIMGKGYDKETANDLAMRCFDDCESLKNGMTVEWFIEKIASFDEWQEEQRIYGGAR